MPLFEISGEKLKVVEQNNFSAEKALQRLIETNLETVFACRFVASEFSTGQVHAGRIDTLALSEEDNPVIIEYKKIESSELLNQSLFYLAWLQDHRGDFEKAARKSLGSKVEVDWTSIRVICLAPNYRKYDLHAARVMGVDIELWTYRVFRNQILYIEEQLQKALVATSSATAEGKNPVMVEAGKKAAQTRATGSYSFDEHLEGKAEHVKELALAIDELVMGLDPAMEQVPKKLYVAYRISKNIVCMEIQHQKILLFLKLNPKAIAGPPKISRDVTSIGHFGTGDLEVTIKSLDDVESTKPFIRMAYEQGGG